MDKEIANLLKLLDRQRLVKAACNIPDSHVRFLNWLCGGPLPVVVRTKNADDDKRLRQDSDWLVRKSLALIRWSAPLCRSCGKKQYVGGKRLKSCRGCCLEWYCNATCQKKHWPTHKLWCGKQKSMAFEMDDPYTPTFIPFTPSGTSAQQLKAEFLAQDLIDC